MKLLHISAQKPSSTGSGVFITNNIISFDKKGYEQAIIAGISSDEKINININNKLIKYPVYFNSASLPFDVVGMSDVMPYANTLYKNLTNVMLEQWICAFKNVIKKAIEEFNPDVILCHHLYLLTALVKNMYPNKKIIGICHGTGLRQLKSHNLENDFIINNIKNLDAFSCHHPQEKQNIIDTFGVDENKVHITVTGYSSDDFLHVHDRSIGEKINLVFTGKLCRSKGIESLIKAYSTLPISKDSICLNLVGSDGGCGYDAIKILAKNSPLPIKFWGVLNHDELNEVYKQSHIFILPSFYEGLPLVFVEAISTGLCAIISDLPGVKEVIGTEINNSGKVKYIPLPRLKNVDVPYEEDLSSFEDAIQQSILEMIAKVKNGILEKKLDLSHLSWDKLAQRVEELF